MQGIVAVGICTVHLARDKFGVSWIRVGLAENHLDDGQLVVLDSYQEW